METAAPLANIDTEREGGKSKRGVGVIKQSHTEPRPKPIARNRAKTPAATVAPAATGGPWFIPSVILVWGYGTFGLRWSPADLFGVTVGALYLMKGLAGDCSTILLRQPCSTNEWPLSGIPQPIALKYITILYRNH